MDADLVHYQNRKPSFSLIILLVFKITSVLSAAGLMVLHAVDFVNIWGAVVVGGVIVLVLLYWMIVIRRDKSSFKIYPDSIVFFSEYYPEEKEVFPIDEIFQVRYEDDFGDSQEAQIYLYLNSGHQLKSKKLKNNRIVLGIDSYNWIDDIIGILRFFQARKKQVYISTRYQEIKEELGLENWT
ncbi:MAG: hypothetical protein AAFP77_30715 [Bacteroidota bacterium]